LAVTKVERRSASELRVTGRLTIKGKTRPVRFPVKVERSRDGAEGLAAADRFRPQLVILDVMMPGLDGYAVAQRLRLIPTLKNVAIIFLTAKGGPMDVVKGIQSGARFYVSKPFKMDDLLAKVRKALGE
jgi:DNA-binding response OmpR family regulator